MTNHVVLVRLSPGVGWHWSCTCGHHGERYGTQADAQTAADRHDAPRGMQAAAAAAAALLDQLGTHKSGTQRSHEPVAEVSSATIRKQQERIARRWDQRDR